MCPNCKHELSATDLIPVFSWLWLRGKCRYCKEPISVQYPLVELSTAALFIVSYVFWPYPLHAPWSMVHFASWLITLTGFMALIVYDLRWMILPNKIVKFLVVVAGLQVITKALSSTGSLQPIVAAFWGVLVISGLFYVLFQISGGKWIGGGDVKLAVVLGLLVGGPLKAIMLIFLACLMGSLVGIFIIIVQKTDLKTKIPFGPFLIVATIIVYLFGTGITSWYQTHLLYL